jgi:AsmA protein
MAGILDNPEAAYAKLRELGSGLFGTGTGLPGSPDNPLVQNIESLIDRAGGERKGSNVPTAGERLPPPRPAPQVAPQVTPQAQSRPQPAPSPGQSPSQGQSTSQSQSAFPPGPIEFLQKLFGR